MCWDSSSDMSFLQSTLYPVAGSFATFGTRFIDPAWGFAMGWKYVTGLVSIPVLMLTIVWQLCHELARSAALGGHCSAKDS